MFRNIGWQTNDCRSQWPRGLRRVTAAARLLGLRARIPPRAWMSVSCDCCVLSGRGICDGLITRPEESYQVWCVWVWSCSIDNEEALAHWGLLLHWKQNKLLNATPLHAYAFATQHYKEAGLAPRSGRFPPRERLGTHCTGGCVGPKAGVDGCGKSCLHWDFFF